MPARPTISKPYDPGRPMKLPVETDAALLARIDGLARLMDSHFRIPGTNIRFGLDPVIDLIPGVGDLAGVAISGYLIWEARRLGAPKSLMARMAGNVAMDFILGAVPLAGTIADVFWRANDRNIRLLRGYLQQRRR